MFSLFRSNIGRLRLIGFLEGASLLLLVFIAVPLKYIWHNDQWVRSLGSIHGALFLLFVFNTISVSIQQKWVFSRVTWKVLVACMIPFGTFYIDHTLLRTYYQATLKKEQPAA